VYKWTDENGVTQFGDPKPAGRQAEQVNIRTGTSQSAGNARPSPQERVQALEEQQQESAANQAESAVERARQKQREANCATARANLDVISTTARIRVDENGEMRYLTPEEIDAKRQEFEDLAAENCGEASASQ
jgi:hypothetical protein